MDARSMTGLLSTLGLVGTVLNSPLSLLRSSVAACTRTSKPPRPALERVDEGEFNMLDIDAADGRDPSFGEPYIEDVRDSDVDWRVDGGFPEKSMLGLDGPTTPGPRREERTGS